MSDWHGAMRKILVAEKIFIEEGFAKNKVDNAVYVKLWKLGNDQKDIARTYV